jgi:hypothetical protein
VIAELEREPVERDDLFGETATLLDDVRAAFTEEAADIIETDAVSLDDEPVRVSFGSDDEEKRPVIVVRHRFDRRADDERARRIIVLRDRRRGRARHGNDPPE